MPREDGKETLENLLTSADQGISSFSEEMAKFRASVLSIATIGLEGNDENQHLHRSAV